MLFGFRKKTRAALSGYLGKSAIATAGMGLSMLFSYLFHLVMARMLLPSDYGELSALAALFVIATLPMMSVQGLFSREVARLEQAGRKPDAFIKKYAKETVLWGLVVSVALSLAAALLFGGLSPLAVGAILTLLSIPFGYGAAVITGYYQGKEKLLELNALINAPVLLRLLIAALMVLAGFGVLGAAWSFPLGFALVLLPLALFYKWFSAKEKGSFEPKISVGGSYLRILSANFLLVVFLYLDLFFVRMYLGPEKTGYYNAAGVMAKIPFYISTSLAFVLLPQASRLTFADKGELAGRFVKSAMFIIPFALVFGIAAYPFLSFFFGGKYAENGAAAFGVLSVAMVLFGLANLLVNILWSQGKELVPLALSILILPLQAALLYVLVPSGGLFGAAEETLVSSALLFAASGAAVAYYSAKKAVVTG